MLLVVVPFDFVVVVRCGWWLALACCNVPNDFRIKIHIEYVLKKKSISQDWGRQLGSARLADRLATGPQPWPNEI